MAISAVRDSTYTPAAPKAQRVDTQRTLELRQQNQPNAIERRNASTHAPSTLPTADRRDAAPPKDKGSRVDVRV